METIAKAGLGCLSEFVSKKVVTNEYLDKVYLRLSLRRPSELYIEIPAKCSGSTANS